MASFLKSIMCFSSALVASLNFAACTQSSPQNAVGPQKSRAIVSSEIDSHSTDSISGTWDGESGSERILISFANGMGSVIVTSDSDGCSGRGIVALHSVGGNYRMSDAKSFSASANNPGNPCEAIVALMSSRPSLNVADSTHLDWAGEDGESIVLVRAQDL